MTERRFAALNDFLTPGWEDVTVEDDVLYTRVTVHNRSQGLSKRDQAYGRDIGTKRQYRVRAGQWLVARYDIRNGAHGLVPQDLDGAVVTQHFPAFAVDSTKCLPEYLRLWASRPAFWEECELISEGSTNRSRIDPEQFLSLEILLPSLDAQRETVESIAKVDALIDAVKEEVTSARNVFQSARHEAWADLDEAAERIAIKDLTRVTSGGTPSRQRSDFFGGDIPWVKTGEVAFCEIEETEEHITELGLKQSSAKLFPAETVLVAMYGRGTVGRSAIITRPMTTNQACAGILPCDRLVPQYLFHWLWSHYSDIIDLAEGTTNLTNISKQIVESLEIPVPPVSRQRELASDFNTLRAVVDAYERELESLVQLRRAMLETLLAGDINAPLGEPVVA